MEKRRRLFAAFLLAVFLPALLAAFLHTHPEKASTAVSCIECTHHVPHTGHLSSAGGGLQDCILCHFVGLPFLLAATLAVSPACRRLSARTPVSIPFHLLPVQDSVRSRAPPVPAVI